MLSHLMVIHRPNKKLVLDPSQQSQSPWLLWQTCLRQMAFGVEPYSQVPSQMLPDDRLLLGQQAYTFLLEVACGLHSPMMGETEVLGQIRQFFALQQFSNDMWGKTLRHLSQALVTDAKLIRKKHLIGLGSQTYGSLARRLLRDEERVVILGAGQLAQEILPWLMKEERQVEVYSRRRESAENLRQSFPRLAATGDFEASVLNGDSAHKKRASVIVVAPLSAIKVEEIAQSLGVEVRTIIDLRGEGVTDPIGSTPRVKETVVDLQTFFSQIQATKALAEKRVEKAREHIEKIARDRLMAAEVRPFGWEDLCYVR